MSIGPEEWADEIPVVDKDTNEAVERPAPQLSLLPAIPAHFGTGRRVLLVEDEDPIRRLITTYLVREGFSVVESMDAAGAVRALAQEFDIVITDYRLPGPSGNELVPVVKARWPMTQVIVITGFRDAQVAAEALNSGADRYLFKPFGMPELQEHLSGALARRDRMLAYRQEHIDLTAEAKRRGEDARESILNGARALVMAVEVRDQYTRGHSLRVADYSVILGRELNARGGNLDLEALRLACELHDVGKIGIPDAILNKPRALTADEFFLVQRHPAVGKRILEPLFGDELILAVTVWHHERWDGEGYPDHLAGEAIPLPARLVAYADTLDAMTSSRAYRSALRWDDAVRQIRERGGSQFDPHLMDLFEASLPQLEEAFRTSMAG
jgi:putative two-component system response regulator